MGRKWMLEHSEKKTPMSQREGSKQGFLGSKHPKPPLPGDFNT